MQDNEYVEMAKTEGDLIVKTLVLRKFMKLYICLGWRITREWKVTPSKVLLSYGISRKGSS
jgi:hypothetical protein